MKVPHAIVTDLDGTLTNTMDEVCSILWTQLGVALCANDVRQYDVAEAFWERSMSIRGIFQHCTALGGHLERNIWSNPDVYQRLKPYFDWHQALQMAMACDVNVVLLTSRPAESRVVAATEFWASTWGYGECELLFSRAYEGGKVEALTEIMKGQDPFVHHTWFVDDDPNIWTPAKKIPGLFVTALRRPWTIPCAEHLIDAETLCELLRRHP